MKTTATNKRIRELLTDIADGKLVPRPEFQRRLIWAMKHKNAFIKTVLEGYPFPEIYIAAGDVDLKTGKGTLMLVDGQQRLTTLYEYFHGSKELRLNKDIPRYDQLEPSQQKAFLEYEVVVRDLGALEIDEIKEVFRRINSTSYALNAMEVHNARYDGEYKTLAEELSTNRIFEEHKFFSANEIRRMEDVKFALMLITTMLSTYFHRNEEIEEYLGKYNDEFPLKEVVREEFNQVCAFLEQCDFPKESRIWKRADFFTAFIELHHFLFKKGVALEPELVKQVLEKLYQDVEAVRNAESSAGGLEDRGLSGEELVDAKQYAVAALQGTNDRTSRILRGRIVRARIEAALRVK